MERRSKVDVKRILKDYLLDQTLILDNWKLN